MAAASGSAMRYSPTATLHSRNAPSEIGVALDQRADAATAAIEAMTGNSKQANGETAMRIAAAATLFFSIVFGVGFLLGPIRIFWLEPRIGPTYANRASRPLRHRARAHLCGAVGRIRCNASAA